MKTIFLFFILLFIVSDISAQYELKIIVRNKNNANPYLFLYGRLVGTENKTEQLDKDTNTFKYTVRNLDEYSKIQLFLPTSEYIYLIKDFHYRLKNEKSVIYVLDYLDFTFEKKELSDSMIKAKEFEKKQNLRNKLSVIFNDAVELLEYYTKNIDGKRELKIAEFLYDEGFSRSYNSSGSVIETVYSKFFRYDTEFPYKRDNLMFSIKLWYSYGYERLFYDINFSIDLVDYGCVILNGKETKEYNKLMED